MTNPGDSDRCAGTLRDGGPCTFTRAGHADGKPHAFVEAAPAPAAESQEIEVAEMARTVWLVAGAEQNWLAILTSLAEQAFAAGLARGIEEAAKRYAGYFELARCIAEAFDCECKFEGDVCPCGGDGNDDEGCWNCQANAAIADAIAKETERG